jgi:hypothetical protein
MLELILIAATAADTLKDTDSSNSSRYLKGY